jgi:Tir chaperone protein (CesT) family
MSMGSDRRTNEERHFHLPKIIVENRITNPFRSIAAGMGNGPYRVGFDEEVLRKNRRLFDSLLKRCGSIFGKDVFLNSEGMSYVSHGRFVIIVEVPTSPAGYFYIYTLVCRLTPTDNTPFVLQRAMQLNFMEYGTRGATLGLQDDEITLCFSSPIAGLTAPKLRETIEAFVQSAIEANEYLESAKKFHMKNLK